MESKNPINQFNVIILGIIFDPKERRILIGRREKDPHIPQLSWCFPGGKPEKGEELEEAIKREIKEETNLDVKNLGTIFAKTYPEKKDLVAIYFLCESIGGEEKVGGELKELKWVKPDELESHFTTSFHPHLKEYILNLS
ncbi:MAG: NUDIX hydrolase [Nanoarchaeota archaeon]|nr:NUDIX hydrolase [Nanoarchaeota archaeon]